MELSPDPAFSRVGGLPPAQGLWIEGYAMLTVGLALIQAQGRVFAEDSPETVEPYFEDFPLSVAKFCKAMTAASCCAHACVEVRCGRFNRAWRISSGEMHGSFGMLEL